jgi:GTP-binding protein
MPLRTPSVVLVGRPNVGKSTLFNRMTGTRRAIVTAIPGTTRDTLEKPVVWRGVPFRLTDTGGLFGESEDPLHELVIRQGQRAIRTADLLVMVVDGREGLVPADEDVAREARQSGRRVLVAINKTDDKRAKPSAMEFFQLGFDPVFEISAEHGQGVAELMDEIVSQANKRAEHVPGTPAGKDSSGTDEAEDDSGQSAADNQAADEMRVAIVGRPNVGKSSLVNRLLREERVLVSDVPGTTRDTVDAVLTWHRRRFRIIDTAGMRRPGRVIRGGKVELVSVAAAKRAVAEADVVVLVVDANAPLADQDAAIGGEADRAGRGIVIVANKWDLLKGQGGEGGQGSQGGHGGQGRQGRQGGKDLDWDVAKVFDEEARRQMKFLEYAPILHVSALTGERVAKVLQTIDRVAAARRTRVPTSALNKFVEAVTAANPPVSPGRHHVRIMYAAQVGIAPPSFVFFTNIATTFHFSYERFLVNQLRERFGFEGTPIRLQVRRRAK